MAPDHVPLSERERFASWIVVEFALALAAMLVAKYSMPSLPGAQLSDRYLIIWASTFGGSMLLAAVVAGLLVFPPGTPRRIILTRPWLVGLAVGLASFFGRRDHSGAAVGFSAVVAVAAALVLGGAFITAAALRRRPETTG